MLPDTFKLIDHEAFAYCDNLKDIWYEGTISDWHSIQKGIDWKAGVSDLKVHTMRDHKIVTYI